MRVDVLSRCAIAILALGLFSGCIVGGKSDKKTPVPSPTATAAARATTTVASIVTATQTTPTQAPVQASPSESAAATVATAPESTPEATPVVSSDAIQLVAKGAGQDSAGQASYGFIIKNTKTDQALVAWQYHLIAYGPDGSILKTDTNIMPVIFPGEQIGIGNHLFLDQGQKLDHVDVQFVPGQAQPFKQISDLTTANATYVGDPYFPKVTGTVKNPFNVDINLVGVSVVAYDAAGNIVGGGFTFLNFVAANGEASTEVGVVTASPPAKVEMYAMVGDISYVSQ